MSGRKLPVAALLRSDPVAFCALWEALAQYVENAEADEPDIDKARTDAARVLRIECDTAMAALAETFI